MSGRGFHGLIFALDGAVEYTIFKEGIAADSLMVNAGDAVLIPSDISYTVTNKENIGFHHYTVNFILSHTEPQDGIASRILTGGDIAKISVKNPTMYTNLYEKLVSRWSGKRAGYKMEAMSCLYELIYNFLTEYISENIDKNAYDKILPAKKYIDKYYMRTITLQQLAEMCGISITHFRRLFTDIYNISPIGYQMQLRILMAQDLLMCGFYSICEVAEMTGFSDPNYFSRFFKLHIGISPAKFRKLY